MASLNRNWDLVGASSMKPRSRLSDLCSREERAMSSMRYHIPKVGCCGRCEAKSEYFADFLTVELQSSFYELPSLALASRWRALAPPAFHFSLKAWQLITHTPCASPCQSLRTRSGMDLFQILCRVAFTAITHLTRAALETGLSARKFNL
jgi:Protein of unknown function DUF72